MSVHMYTLRLQRATSLQMTHHNIHWVQLLKYAQLMPRADESQTHFEALLNPPTEHEIQVPESIDLPPTDDPRIRQSKTITGVEKEQRTLWSTTGTTKDLPIKLDSVYRPPTQPRGYPHTSAVNWQDQTQEAQIVYNYCWLLKGVYPGRSCYH